MDSLIKDIEKISLNNNNENKLLLEKLKLKSPFSKERDITLPTLESLSKLNHFFPLKSSEKIATMSDVVSILEKNSLSELVLETAIILVGGINSANEEFYLNYIKNNNSNSEKLSYIDDEVHNNCSIYENYIKNNISTIMSGFKILEFNQLIEVLEKAGFKTNTEVTENILLLLKKLVYQNDKILVIICGNNFSWFKSERKSLGHTLYDANYNKFQYLYYNKSFLDKAFLKFLSHPRVELGFVSSMMYKNLIKIILSLKKSFSQYLDKANFDEENEFNKKAVQENKKLWLFHQDHHTKKPKSNLTDKDEFFRSFSKMANISNYNETNILILESEEDKVNETSSTIENTIYLPYYIDENFFKNNVDNSKIDEDFINKLINDVIDKCDDDIRKNIHNFNINKKKK